MWGGEEIPLSWPIPIIICLSLRGGTYLQLFLNVRSVRVRLRTPFEDVLERGNYGGGVDVS